MCDSPWDPERIYQAQRVGIFARLRDAERLGELEAEHLIAQWEREAEAIGRERGSTGFWDEGWRWIEDQRGARITAHTSTRVRGR